jgi:hypothetical protein
VRVETGWTVFEGPLTTCPVTCGARRFANHFFLSKVHELLEAQSVQGIPIFDSEFEAGEFIYK